MLKKKTVFAWNLHLLEVECKKGDFQIQPPISGFNFSNMSLTQAKVNMSETEHDITWLKPFNY